MVCKFVWKGGGDQGLHLVDWNSIARSRQEGGLGLRQAHRTNIAMLGKLIAEIYENYSKLWVCFLLEKYGHHEGFLSMEPISSSSSTWKDITHAHSLLRDGFKMRLGNGVVPFWHDNWLNDRPLTQTGPLCAHF